MAQVKNTNFPTNELGETFHVGVKRGEVSNRILTVGDPERARKLATFLESISLTKESKRGFLTITGTFRGVAISIVAIGMGTPMADFAVRELRHVVDGDIALIRFGTTGGIGPLARVGLVTVASPGAVMISRNYDYFNQDIENGSTATPYTISQVCPSDPKLSSELKTALTNRLGEDAVIEGINATADSFYSSQGRIDPSFHDANSDIIDTVCEKYPDCQNLEMESFMFLHLARCSRPQSIYASACALIIFDRKRNIVLEQDKIDHLERAAGAAVLEALANFSF
eukprot:jgi/Hompol1/5778/HPOL_004686-RA